MEYDRGDSFPSNFELNGIPFGLENRKENCHYDLIPFNVKGNGNIVYSVKTVLETGVSRVLGIMGEKLRALLQPLMQ